MTTFEQQAIAATAAMAADLAPPPSLDVLWRALDAVPDPEIPVVSVIELGIVRGLQWDEGDPATLVVRVTPTYSGCPATELIMTGIRDALAAAGVTRVRLETQLAPAWTTDWIAPHAREKLRGYGIAPPARGAAAAVPVDVSALRSRRRATAVVPCPRCGSERTRVLSQFGSTACKAQYRCDACLEPFDYFKPH
jgi:ring-1,2-phenylacetyl-CoA epoxidase subunit PaaD